MSQDKWSAVDAYIVDRLVPTDPILDTVLANNQAAGLPQHDVSANQGRFLHLLARMIGARRVLEIGTLGAYSTICLARALPEDGRVVTLEFDAHHAAVAQKNIEHAGLTHKIDLRVGSALETLPLLQAEGSGPFDVIFIDADKPNNPGYLEWALKLARPGTVIVGDNVVRDGAVVDAHNADPRLLRQARCGATAHRDGAPDCREQGLGRVHHCPGAVAPAEGSLPGRPSSRLSRRAGVLRQLGWLINPPGFLSRVKAVRRMLVW